MKGTYRELIIIGAPRSGTNMLRDVLCSFDGFGTWPCDEINYVWRHRNARWPTDEFPADLASHFVVSYINRCFQKQALGQNLEMVVEKTCANSLRVPFVERVLPQANFVFIYRDPVDAVVSAAKRWRSKFDLVYTLKKARFVPTADFPYYLSRFVENRFRRLTSQSKQLGTWGPRFAGIDEAVASRPLIEVCAEQWNRCAELAATALTHIERSKVHIVGYEDFVSGPVAELRGVGESLGAKWETEHLHDATRSVSRTSVGKGQAALDAATLDRVAELTLSGANAIGELKKALRVA